jgi:hypothetical protein
MTILQEDEETIAHKVEIDAIADELVEKMKTLPPANIIYYCEGFEQAEGMLINVAEYEDLSEAIWVMLHRLAEQNGEVFAIELSQYHKNGRYIHASGYAAISFLKTYADKGGAASDLLFNRYLRSIAILDAGEVSQYQSLLRRWSDEGVFDADKLGSKHRPAYDRLMAIDVQSLFALEDATTAARRAEYDAAHSSSN